MCPSPPPRQRNSRRLGHFYVNYAVFGVSPPCRTSRRRYSATVTPCFSARALVWSFTSGHTRVPRHSDFSRRCEVSEPSIGCSATSQSKYETAATAGYMDILQPLVAPEGRSAVSQSCQTSAVGLLYFWVQWVNVGVLGKSLPSSETNFRTPFGDDSGLPPRHG